MSYSVQYNPELHKKYPTSKKQRNIPVKQIVILVVCFTLAYIIAQNKLYKLFLPGNPDVTTSALVNFTQKVGGGESFKEAVYCFCEEVIRGGK